MKSKGTVRSTQPPTSATGELFGQAVALHPAGKPEEALELTEQSLAAGEQSAEVHAAGYLHYEQAV